MLPLRPIRRRLPRHGFSLVELLVSITIFVILATLAVATFRDSKRDKIGSGARQVVSVLGGARSRAAKAIEPRGFRLLQDKTDYRLITGTQYIGQSQLHSGTVRVQMNAAGQTTLLCQQLGDWSNLYSEGVLKPGERVYLWNYPSSIPPPHVVTVDDASGGRWYTISSNWFAPYGEDINRNGSLDPGEDINGNGALDVNEQRLQIVGNLDGATWSGSYWQSQPSDGSPYPAWSNTRPVPYLMRLTPQILPETEPVNLPPGVVIDLLSSVVPPSWLTFEDRNQNGVLDTASPTEDLNGNGALDDVRFDIPVSPNGTIAGAVSGSGPIYLYVCARDDFDRMLSMPGYAVGYIPGDFENGYGPDHPSSERKVICIIPQTGLSFVAQVNGADVRNNTTNAAGADGWADDPFSFARDGRESR